MEQRADGKTWFAEYGQMWPGQAMSLEIKEKLEDFKSDYQHVIVADTATYGKMLVLDGAIQVTDRDELSYHECSATPLASSVHSHDGHGGDGPRTAKLRSTSPWRPKVREVLWSSPPSRKPNE